MKPAPFLYHRAETLEEAVALLGEHGGEAKVIAGGQSLVPLMNFRLARPERLVDVNRVAALESCKETGDGLRLGALTRHATLTRPEIRAGAPLLSLAAPFIGHPAIRTRGTLGGSAAHADSSAEIPGALLAHDAQITATSVRGTRAVPAGDFFLHHFTTALAEDELLTAVTIPPPAGAQGCGFGEVSARRGDFALAGSFVRLAGDGAGRIADARVVLIGVAPTPLRVPAAEEALVAEGAGEESLRRVQAIVNESVEPTPRLHASAAYLARAAAALTRRSAAQARQMLERSAA